MAHSPAPLRWLSLGRWRKTQTCRARARAALVAIGLRTMEWHCTGGRPLSYGARPWCDVRAVASNAQPVFVWHTRKRHCGGYLSGGGKTRKLAARARRAALVVDGLRIIKGHCAGEMPLSFGARPWCDVRAVTSNAQPAFACPTRERHCSGCLSGGGKTRKLAVRSRRAALAVIGLYTMQGQCIGGMPVSYRARRLCDVRAVNLNAQPAFACPTRECHCAGCLSGSGKTRKLAVRARRAALAVIGLRTMKGQCIGGIPFSFGARRLCCKKPDGGDKSWWSQGRWFTHARSGHARSVATNVRGSGLGLRKR